MGGEARHTPRTRPVHSLHMPRTRTACIRISMHVTRNTLVFTRRWPRVPCASNMCCVVWCVPAAACAAAPP